MVCALGDPGAMTSRCLGMTSGVGGNVGAAGATT